MASIPLTPLRRHDSFAAESRETAPDTLYAAVVHAGGRICFLTAAPTRSLLAERLAAYVREHAPIQLRSFDAQRVMELVVLGDHEQAINLYFGSVGEKWDEERLVVTQTPHQPMGADRVAVKRNPR